MLFVVQGEGRGHMTQALALSRFVEDTEHSVVGCVVSLPDGKAVPEFFLARHGLQHIFHKQPASCP